MSLCSSEPSGQSLYPSQNFHRSMQMAWSGSPPHWMNSALPRTSGPQGFSTPSGMGQKGREYLGSEGEGET